jgi:diguanylate cyclase (GGDEF)-like protein
MLDDAQPVRNRASPRGRFPRAVIAVMVVLLIAYLAGLLLGADALGADGAAFVDGLGIAVEVAAVVLCITAVMRAHRTQWQVLLGAAAIICYAFGDTYYLLTLNDASALNYVSVADVAYILFYVLMLGAVAVMVQKFRGLAWPVLVDSIVGALSSISLMALVLAPLQRLHAPDQSALEVLVTVVYPSLDLLLIMTVCGVLSTRGLDVGPRWPLLGGGLVLFTAADTAYALDIDAYAVGSLIDAGWVTGVAAIALWVDGIARPDRISRYRFHGVPDYVTPVLSTVTALVVLAVGCQMRIPLLAQVAAISALGLAAVPLVFRNHMLLTLATTDELTGLPNRRALLTDVPPRLHKAKHPGALFVLDLDHFKDVNDALGHDVGDALLLQVGQRLSSQLRPGDFFARLGGDEFAVFLDNASPEAAVEIAQRLKAALEKPIEVGAASLQVDVSIGIALTPVDGTNLNLLMRKADIAMYRAKTERLGHSFYNSIHDDASVGKLQTLQELRTAFAQDEFELHYQPKVRLSPYDRSGIVHPSTVAADIRIVDPVNVEALVRWNHPSRGQLLPAAFLPLAEEAGLMPALSTLVLARAIGQVAEWAREDIDVVVAVNLPGSYITTDLTQQTLALLQEHEVPPQNLILEITEDVLMSDPDRTAGILQQLRSEGIQISIDDFGTGYSSLAYLRDLPVDELKLDRSFITAMHDDERASGLVSSIIDLAHSLELRVVAEGIDNEQTSQELRLLGCDFGQGYYFLKPLPAPDLTSWLQTTAITAITTTTSR